MFMMQRSSLVKTENYIPRMSIRLQLIKLVLKRLLVIFKPDANLLRGLAAITYGLEMGEPLSFIFSYIQSVKVENAILPKLPLIRSIFFVLTNLNKTAKVASYGLWVYTRELRLIYIFSGIFRISRCLFGTIFQFYSAIFVNS